MGLLDQLGCSRATSHLAVVGGARDTLLDRIQRLDPEMLLHLLDASFAYIGLPELRAIPLAVLDKLQPVPATFLKQLTTDKELFRDLPRGVQRQVWELDKKLLQQHALPLVTAYTFEGGTLIRSLDMDECLPAGAEGGGKLHIYPARRILRGGSSMLKKMVDMVGRSVQIYKGVCELCIIRYKDSDSLYVGVKEAAYCSLRSQLLMALHDAGATELLAKEPCHKLAWTLDACLKERTLNEKHARELQNFFALYDVPGKGNKAGGRGGGSERSTKRGAEEDAESMGRPGVSSSHADDPSRILGDAGLILRDPSICHLIVHQIIRRLEAVAEAENHPSEDADLVFLTRLLRLAMGCRKMLRERAYSFPAASSELLSTFYPILTGYVVESLCQDSDAEAEAAGKGPPEPDASLVNLLTKDEIVRKVTQVYTLERLAFGDVTTGTVLMAALNQAFQRLEKSLPEWAPFAATLAKRLAVLLRQGRIDAHHRIWKMAVDDVLVRCVDILPQVHEEVLRLLLAAAPKLPIADVAQYLQDTLHNSRKSRRRSKKRRYEELDVLSYSGYSSGGGYNSAGGYSSGGGALYGGGAYSSGGLASDGRSVQGGQKEGNEVRYMYQELAKRVKGLSEATAPALFQYLEQEKAAHMAQG
ncbi:hypothetical protein WJX72_000208 [[Myrmecia] bisecta]|uniref:Uncharacterized protein n=1 Tax=[Myrmecia] bisecta TaxID=41462 RepID=A0AAW1P9U6_9CHLO